MLRTGHPARQPHGARPVPGLSAATSRLPDDAQENPVHPDLYLTIYRQQMHRLEQRLEIQCATDARGEALRPTPRRHPHLPHLPHLPLHRRTAAHR